jgi:hypothetical protein
MSVICGLLAGHAPLRDTASLELLVCPPGYRGAGLLGASDLELALPLHPIADGARASPVSSGVRRAG